MIMIDYIIRLNDEIDEALFHIAIGRATFHNRDVIKRLEPEINRLEKDKEFRKGDGLHPASTKQLRLSHG